MTNANDKKFTLKKEVYDIKKHAPIKYVITKPYEDLPPINPNIRIDNTPFYAKFYKKKKKRKR